MKPRTSFSISIVVWSIMFVAAMFVFADGFANADQVIMFISVLFIAVLALYKPEKSNQNNILMKKITVDLKDIGNVEVNVPEGCTVKLDGSHICVVKEKKEELLTWEEIIRVTFSEKTESWDKTFYETPHFLVNNLRQVSKLCAIAQLMVIADYYNKEYANGWVADYRDLGQEKFYPDWGNASHNPSFHSFHACSGCSPAFASVELIKKAYENNRQIFETALKP